MKNKEKIEFYNFYRLDFCLRNLGIGIIGILSLRGWPPLFYSAVTIFQILLVQMFSFSTNNIFDYEAWDEENHSGTLMEHGWAKKTVLVYSSIPLFFLFFTFFVTGAVSWLLILYLVLFHLYQAPGIRLKNHYISSIIINAVCLGSLLYIYPFIAISREMNSLAWGFTLIFGIYLVFHEILHQVAHLGRDIIISLPQVKGIPRSYFWMKVTLAVNAAVALAFALYDIKHNNVFLITFIFSILRIFILNKEIPSQENALKLRLSRDKFYTLQECLIYAVILIVLKIWS